MRHTLVLLITALLGLGFVASCNDDNSSDDTETPTGTNTENQDTNTENPGTSTDDTSTGDPTTDDTGSGSNTGKDTTTQQPTETQEQGDPCGDSSPWECSPLTNEGCDTSEACAWRVAKKVGAFRCDPAGTRTAFQPCSPTAKCAAGLHCISGVCATYCCGNEDCSPVEPTTDTNPAVVGELPCSHQESFNDNITGGTLGVCAPEPQADDPCVAPLGFACDPLTNEGCEEGQACTFASFGPEAGFFCVTNTTQGEGETCNLSTGILCTAGLQCVGVSASESVCTPLCCDGTVECATGSCDTSYFSQDAAIVLGETFGICADLPPECPWTCDSHWIATTECEGIGYHGYDCGANQICCMPIEDTDSDTEMPSCPVDEADTTTDTSTDTEEPSAFTCIAKAAIPTCAAVHYEMVCGNANQVCCEDIGELPNLDTDTGSDTGIGEATDTGNDTGSDTGSDTSTGEATDTGSETLASDSETPSESETLSATDSGTDTETECVAPDTDCNGFDDDRAYVELTVNCADCDTSASVTFYAFYPPQASDVSPTYLWGAPAEGTPVLIANRILSHATPYGGGDAIDWPIDGPIQFGAFLDLEPLSTDGLPGIEDPTTDLQTLTLLVNDKNALVFDLVVLP